MADFNLEAMSLNELQQLQKDFAKAISTQHDRHRADARAKEMGYCPADLTGVGIKTTRALAIVRSHYPESSALTWSGRSRKPQWFAAALNADKMLGDLAVGDFSRVVRTVKADMSSVGEPQHEALRALLLSVKNAQSTHRQVDRGI